MRDVVERSQTIGWMSEADGNCIYRNSAWSDFTGQLVGQGDGDAWIYAVHEDDQQSTLDCVMSATAAAEIYSVRYRLLGPDGKYHWVVDMGHPAILSHEMVITAYVGSIVTLLPFSSGASLSETLTPRERDVLTWVARGKTSLEIALICSISTRTADTHVETAMHKLSAASRTQAVAEAIRLGLIVP